jgi:hypothetical protein
MTFGELGEWTNALGAKEKLSSEVRQRIARELPSFVRDIDPKTAPKRLKLPTGESLGDATRMTAIKCHCLLLARKVHGSGFVKAESEYEVLAKDLLFWVMRHNFNTGDPKGVSLPACTISLLHFTPLGASDGLTATNSSRQSSAMVSSVRIQRQYPNALCPVG